jgi:phosphotransferase system HPr (HPr) family protein
MYSRLVTLANATGLHVRPATLFMETASRFQSAIRVRKDTSAVDGKSAIALMLLEAGCGAQLTIEADGGDEVAAVDALVELVERRFGQTSASPGISDS